MSNFSALGLEGLDIGKTDANLLKKWKGFRRNFCLKVAKNVTKSI